MSIMRLMKQYLNRITYNKKSAAILAVCLAAAGIFIFSAFASTPSLVKEVAITELGVISNPSAPYLLRDVGVSGLLGGRVLWAFGDTIFFRKSTSGYNGYSNTAAYSMLSTPTVVSEVLDAKGAPESPLLPFTVEELNYNKNSGDPSKRYALWPAAIIPESSGSVLVLYDRLKVYPGTLNYEHISTGLARVRAGSTTAERVNDSLFVGKSDQYLHSHVAYGGYHYFYNCTMRTASMNSDCSVARTTTVLDRSQYTFWNGSAWTADITKAVKTIPGSTSGFSVSYNPYLKSFVSATSTAFSKHIILRTAPNPEGPWSESIVAFTAPSSIYNVYQHPELARNDGRDIVISYYRPEGEFKGKLQLLSLRLNPREVGEVSSNTSPVQNPNTTTPATAAPGVAATKPVTSSPQADYSSSIGVDASAKPVVSTLPEETEQSPTPSRGFWAAAWYYLTAPLRWLASLF